jgi:predicted DNA-binding WGR domain protein
VILRRVLHNTTGNSNKYYELNLCRLSPPSTLYSVVCRWGRIENFSSNNAQEQVKVSGETKQSAMTFLECLSKEKTNKGYRQVGKDMEFDVSARITLSDNNTKSKKVKEDKLEATDEFNWYDNQFQYADRVV